MVRWENASNMMSGAGRSMILIAAIALISSFVSQTSPAQAITLPKPTGPVILTVSGKMTQHNGSGLVRFDRQMLEALGMKKLHSRSFYSKSASTWRGVFIRDLLDYVGGKGDRIEFAALDGYRAAIPIKDFYDFDVLLALQRNGKDLTVRTRGPARIIYPVDSDKALNNTKYAARFVWQIEKMTIK